MSDQLPLVALVGRPNVGKSTLFNRVIGKRVAVVADIAGTTRDRLEGVAEWHGRPFRLVDMAGVETSFSKDTEIGKASQAQVTTALQMADLIVWVLDGKTGPTPDDQNVYALLRRLGRPIVVLINKCDHPKHDLAEFEFARFGLDLITGSALSGRGIEQLLDQVVAQLPASAAMAPDDERELRVSIVGRPNVGKSTLLNALVGQERAVVSSQAGTTRDAVDTVIPAQELFGNTFTAFQTVRIVDTAGIRRPGKVGQGIENWSVVRTLNAVEDSQVSLLLIDAEEGLVHQDLQVAERIVDIGRGFVLLINKWDTILEKKSLLPGTPEEEAERERFLNFLRKDAPFLYWTQVIFISAKDGLNLQYLGQLVLKAYISWNISIDPEQLEPVKEELRRHPRLKNFQDLKLMHSRPPVFHVFVEGKQLPHFSTIRAVENAIRGYFPLVSTPIKIWIVPSVQKSSTKGR